MIDRWFLRIATVLSFLVVLTTYRFLILPLSDSFPEFGAHLMNRQTFFVMHVAAAPIALAIGMFQMMPSSRRKRRTLHRWLGRAYGLAILVGGIGGLTISVTAIGGPVAQMGFTMLAVLWLGTTAWAIWLAMKGQYAEHRVWMLRSFALTFAAVTLRLQLIGFQIAGYSYADASVWLGFTCWVPNLLVAEWLVRNRPRIAT